MDKHTAKTVAGITLKIMQTKSQRLRNAEAAESGRPVEDLEKRDRQIAEEYVGGKTHKALALKHCLAEERIVLIVNEFWNAVVGNQVSA